MITDALARFLETHNIRGPLLVAASGGIDSTALLLAFAELAKIEFAVAHVNHHLRGAESDADEKFVREISPVAVHVADGTLDPDAIRRFGIEGAARHIRYRRMHEIRHAVGATHIVTAHQKNDQAETVLMRLVSGGALAALGGIQPIRGDGVIRPLLTVSREDLERYLADRGVRARIDRSNTDLRFLRNRARAALAKLDPAAIDDLAVIAADAREQTRNLEEALDAVDTSISTPRETRFVAIPHEPWLRRALLHRHIRRLDPYARDVSAADLSRLASQLDRLKRVSVTATLELLRRGGELILRARIEPEEPFETDLRAGETKQIPVGTIALRTANGEVRTATQRFQLPAGAEPQFTIRNRREGDRFQPLGMAQHKKLKDFLIDRKIPAEARDRIPLLVWNGSIVCIAGVEISEAFKVTEGKGERYEVSFEKEDQEGVQREKDRQRSR